MLLALGERQPTTGSTSVPSLLRARPESGDDEDSLLPHRNMSPTPLTHAPEVWRWQTAKVSKGAIGGRTEYSIYQRRWESQVGR